MLGDARGAGLVEYVLALGCVAVVVLLGLRAFGDSVEAKSDAQAACVASLSCDQSSAATDAPSDTPSRRDILANAPAAAALPTGAVPPVPQPAPTPASPDPPWNPDEDPTIDFGKGFFIDGAWGLVEDTAEMIMHPWETVKGLAELASIVYGASRGDPYSQYQIAEIAKAVWDSVSQSATENPIRFIGRATFEVVTFVVAPLKILKAAKAKWLVRATKTAKGLDESGDATRFARKASDVVDAKPIDGLELKNTGVNLNKGTGGLNDVFVAETPDGRKVAVKVAQRTSRDESWLLDLEIERMKQLEPYGGPKPLGKVKIRDENGVLRDGAAMEIVDGVDLGGLRNGTTPPFPVTDKHVESMEELISKLERDGKSLNDINDGNFILTPDGRVVPIDMGVSDVTPSGRNLQNQTLERLREQARRTP